MLREASKVEQLSPNRYRRWFVDDYFDVIIWNDLFGNIVEFHICYDKGGDERVLRWSADTSLLHERVDDGENKPGKMKAMPVYVQDGVCDIDPLLSKLEAAGANLEPGVMSNLLSRIRSLVNRASA